MIDYLSIMEDEDSENGLVDTWTLWEEAYYKEAAIETSLSQINNSSVSFEEIEKNKEECFYSTHSQTSEGSGNSEACLNNVIKELKKNILQENKSDVSKDSLSVPQEIEKNDTKEEKTRNFNVKTEKITEYTHYLGLQPTLLQSECTKYNLLENKVSVLDGHPSKDNCFPSESAVQKFTQMCEISSNSETLYTSNSKIISNNDSKLSLIKNSNSVIVNDAQFLPSTSSKSFCVNSSVLLSNSNLELFKSEPILQSSNLKMTRKVYLCAACETYFENWNLFLHMREVHKRYICLFCLGMFGQAERLSHHLSKKHNISEMTFHSIEEFNDVFKGSSCIVCCSCDKMFSENDNFSHHVCSSLQNKESTSEICSLCRQLNCCIESCMSAPEKKDVVSSQYSTNSLKSCNIASFPSIQTVADGRRHSKRTIKPNRLNNDVYLYTKITNIRSKKTMLENTPEIIEGNENINFNLQKNISIKEKRTQKEFDEHAITKNIIKMSKYAVNSGSNLTNEHLNNLSQNNSHENINNIETLICNDDRNTSAKIKETVGEISRFVNDINISDPEKICNENHKSNIIFCKENKNTISSINKKNEDNVRLKKTMNELENSKGANTENNSINGVHKNSNLNFESQVCNNLNHINQSLFSPICEVKENSTKIDVNPQLAGVKNNTVSSTSTSDRSLVIKICTRNNSVLSISTPISPKSNNIENNKNFKIRNEDMNREQFPNKALVSEENDSVSNNLPIVQAFENENKISAMVINSNIKPKSKSDLILNTTNNHQEEEIEHHSFDQDKIMLETTNENIHGTVLAGEEIPLTDLNVDNLLESMEIEDLLKQCIQAVCSSCVYCNHARHIAVNGKQLSLHLLAEHRFQPQHAAIIIHQKQFIAKLEKNLDSLESYYLNLASYNSKEGTYNTSPVRVYECFHCRFFSTTHKELYLHNRKMHQKPILICIMCKSTFYSYSELLCHLCPGVYAPNFNIQYRCCLCALSNLPSAFRLMVHLRKKHHACDVCLEITGNQQRLSNHVWKHKLHHLCYRCGIAYRNKPDITKHLFWKHGTESILCKKCLQKKWPHIYHFCIPPATFVCEECGLNFSKAVALKVHKRIHINDFPHACFECTEKFISKKLLTRHRESHGEHPPVPSQVVTSINNVLSPLEVNINVCNMETEENNTAQSPPDTILKTSFKKVIDVYDLPPLNLSDSDSEIEEKFMENKKNEKTSIKIENKLNVNFETVVIDSQTTIVPNTDIVGVERNEEEKKQEEQIMDGIWDNFKSYTASLEKQEVSNLLLVGTDTIKKQESNTEEFNKNIEPEILKKVILNDHDYCITYSNKVENQSLSKNPIKPSENMQITQSFDFKLERTLKSGLPNIQNNESDLSKRKIKSFKKKKQSISSSSDSSSDSDSSSCSCGTNCSCSSSSSTSSSTSSSSSDSDSSVLESSSKKINLNQEKYKEEKELIKKKEKNEKEEIIDREQKRVAEKKSSEIDKSEQTKKTETMNLMTFKQLVIMESDLETTETETDEDFYDKHPQHLANKLLSEKHKKLMLLTSSIDSSLSVGVNNGKINTDKIMHSPNLSPILGNAIDAIPSKRKVKTKKHKKGSRERAQNTLKMSELMKVDIPKSVYKKKMFCSLLQGAGKSSTSIKSSLFEKKKIGNSESLELQKTESFESNEFKMGTKRSSKRKRIPKRFYGDSSDEENHKQEMLKWRRIDVPVNEITQLPSTSKINYKQDFQQINYQLLPFQQQELLFQQNQQLHWDKKQLVPQQTHELQKENDIIDTHNENRLLITVSESDLDEQGNTSGNSSDSDNNILNEGRNLLSLPQANIHCSQHLYNAERSNNLYCYCQCPYDEVSEMIACDGDHCQIEWFHFECVGIMIPPKGKWYCPDCRRSLGIPDEIDELANDNTK